MRAQGQDTKSIYQNHLCRVRGEIKRLVLVIPRVLVTLRLYKNHDRRGWRKVEYFREIFGVQQSSNILFTLEDLP